MAEPEHLRTTHERELAGLFRTGRVSSVDAKKHTAQVEFAEQDGFVSFDFPVLVTRPGDYALPAVNSLVLCAVIPGSSGIGYVLGALYSEADAAPLSDAGQRSIESDDLRLGAHDATDAVSLAPAVDDDFDKLKQAIANWTPVAQDGGAALKAALTTLFLTWPKATGAQKVKAK